MIKVTIGTEMKNRSRAGFTIVELLIVIVVIAILAVISIVVYNGIQNRAADSAVQSDLRNMGSVLMNYNVLNGRYPVGELELSTTGVKASEVGYGRHLIDGGTGYTYNLLYCSTVDGYSQPLGAVVGSSKSGRVFAFTNGTMSEISRVTWTEGWGTICPMTLDVAPGDSAAGVWLFENNIWKIWL